MRHVAFWLALFVACAPGVGQTDERGNERPAEAASGVLRGEPEAPAVGTEAGPAYLDRYDFEAGGRSYDLPGRLDEISGLVMSGDGRLFAHDDERGRVHEIDPGSGEVGKHFDLGSGELLDDFEGIAMAGDRFFLVSSSGFLYEFEEGGDEENVGFRATDTGLGAEGCEIEGLDHDATNGTLLFACKQARGYPDFVVIHRRPVDDDAGAQPPIMVRRSDLTSFDLDTDFQASAVVVTPAGTLLLASAATESILEVDAVGRVLAGVALSRRRHPQPEGLALAADGTLFISDEENDHDARLTRYAPRGSRDR